MNSRHIQSIKMIQWNCRGIRGKVIEIESMLKFFEVDIFILSETLLQPDTHFSFNGYQIFRKERNIALGGGVMIMVRNGMKCQQLNTSSDVVEIIAVSINVKDLFINIASIYITNSIVESDLHNILRQLPKPLILAGDFNAHSQAWGSYKEDNRGKTVLDFLSNSELVFLNNGSFTRKACPPKQSSAIDLTLCSMDIALITNWEIQDIPTQSDHHPINIEIVLEPVQTQSRKFEQLNIPAFIKLVQQFASRSCPKIGLEEEYQEIINILYNAADKTQNKRSNKEKYHKNFWWDEECQQLWNEARELSRTHRRSYDKTSFVNLQRKLAENKKIYRQKKLKLGYPFVSQ